MRIARSLALWVACLVAVPVATAAAQALPADYRRIIGEAVGEFDDGNWREARALFEQAHDLYPNARTLRGVGMCAYEMRDYGDAVENLLFALEDTRRPLTAEQRIETQELAQRAMGFVGRFTLTLEPPDAQLTVDDAVLTLNERGELLLTVGDHELVVRSAGYETIRRRVTVHGGESEDIVLELASSSSGGPGAPPTAAVGLWVAGLALVLAEPFTVGWLVDREAALGSCLMPPMDFRCDNEATIAGQRDAAIGLSVGLGVAALGLGTAGLLVWILAGGGDASAELDCRPGLGGVSCSF